MDVIVFDFDGTLFDLAAKWDNLTDDNREEIESKAAGNRTLDPKVVRLLKNLYKNHDIAIFSNNLTSTIESVMRRSGFVDTYIVGRDSVDYIKPHADGLYDIMFHFGTGDALMVGDSQEDVDVAKEFGCPSVIVRNKRKKVRPAGADYYISELYPQ